MRKFRVHPAFGDYQRFGTNRDAALLKFQAVALELGVSEEMIYSPCAAEAMDRIVTGLVDLSLRDPVWAAQQPASLHDMASEMLPGLLRSATPDLLKVNLIDVTAPQLIRMMASLCQLHRRDVVIIRALCMLREKAANGQTDHAVAHPAFLNKRSQLAVGSFESTTKN